MRFSSLFANMRHMRFRRQDCGRQEAAFKCIWQQHVCLPVQPTCDRTRNWKTCSHNTSSFPSEKVEEEKVIHSRVGCLILIHCEGRKGEEEAGEEGETEQKAAGGEGLGRVSLVQTVFLLHREKERAQEQHIYNIRTA